MAYSLLGLFCTQVCGLVVFLLFCAKGNRQSAMGLIEVIPKSEAVVLI